MGVSLLVCLLLVFSQGSEAANAAPTVSISAPKTGAIVTAPATFTITAAATDSDGKISKVEFYNGTKLLGTVTSSPYTYAWKGVAAGTYSVTAKAYDKAGATKTSTAVSLVSNAAPSVTLTSPQANTTLTAPATISCVATANDADGKIAKVEFYNGTTLIGTATASPFSYAWKSVPAGTYAISARSYDDRGATTTSASASVTVKAQNASPTVNLTAPANGAVLTAPATFALTATATDGDGTISKVEFYNGTTLLGTATASPYGYSWNNVAAGSYSLTAKAYDNLGATASSTAVSVISNAPPSAALTAPAANATFSAPASVAISATATDPDGINKVEFYNGTILLGTTTASPYAYTWSNVPAGSYSITAKAYDARGAVASSAARAITVSGPPNSAPSVELLNPVRYATYAAPASIRFVATASDSDGSIAKVEFYNGKTLIGTATTSPFAYTWSNVAAGSYSVSAKAYDNQGGTAVSAANPITVGPASGIVVRITSPVDGAIVSPGATVPISISVTDSTGKLTKLNLAWMGSWLNQWDSPIANPTVTSFTFNLTGINTLIAAATDDTGASVVSDPIVVTVPDIPTVKVTAPLAGSILAGPTTLILTADASASSAQAVTKVDFYSGATLVGSSSVYPYGIAWSNVAPGAYVITAKVYDSANKTANSDPIAVTVGDCFQ